MTIEFFVAEFSLLLNVANAAVTEFGLSKPDAVAPPTLHASNLVRGKYLLSLRLEKAGA